MHPIYEAIQKTSLFKKILSYLFPIKITSFSSFDDKNLAILLERGQFTLSTSDAYYSDGKRYQPFISVRQYLSAKHNIDAMHEVLILGTGLARDRKSVV